MSIIRLKAFKIYSFHKTAHLGLSFRKLTDIFCMVKYTLVNLRESAIYKISYSTNKLFLHTFNILS